MNKQQKILAGILGTGLLAIGVDRLVLDSASTGPQAASAEAAYAVDATPADAIHDDTLDLARTALNEAQVEETPGLARRLTDAASQHDLPSEASRDAFAPSDAWMTAITPVRDIKPTQDADAQRFQQNHRLMAVMTPGGRGVVVVNGRALRVGQRLGDFTLVAVERHSATFHGPGGQVVLKLDP